MSQAGPVLRAEVFLDRNGQPYGLVLFGSTLEAQRALGLDGRFLNGERITVQLVRRLLLARPSVDAL